LDIIAPANAVSEQYERARWSCLFARVSARLQISGMAAQNARKPGAKGATRHPCALIVAAGLLVTSIAGCERRAPGPDECHDLAVAWVRGARARRIPDEQLSRATEEAILERTTDCLTTPYDKELVQCVTAGSAAHACLGGFEARHPGHPVSTTE